MLGRHSRLSKGWVVKCSQFPFPPPSRKPHSSAQLPRHISYQNIQICPNKRWLQSEMSTHSGSCGDFVGTPPPMLPKNSELGRERVSWLLTRLGIGTGSGRIK